MGVFLQHTTNHYDEQSEMLFIYFLSFFCNTFKIIRLSPSGEFCSGSQVNPSPTSYATKKLRSGTLLMNENTNVFTHNFTYLQKMRNIEFLPDLFWSFKMKFRSLIVFGCNFKVS